MIEKHKMLEQMKTISQHVEPAVFQSIEESNTKFISSNARNGIGKIISRRYGRATFNIKPYKPNTLTTATLTLQSQDGSVFSLPPSLISCKLLSSSNEQPEECHINQVQQGKYNISFVPGTTGKHLLVVQIGGVDVSGSPFTLRKLHETPSIPKIRDIPTKTITGLNKPWGIAICDNGDIVVAESGAHCVTVLNQREKKIRSFGSFGIGEGQFRKPCRVAISKDGHILVTDSH